MTAIGLALLIWSISVAITVWLIVTSDMVQLALLITGGAFVLALAFLGWATWLTDRRVRMGRGEVRSERS